MISLITLELSDREEIVSMQIDKILNPKKFML